MRRYLFGLLLLMPTLLVAQSNVAGDWLITTDMYGNALHERLLLKLENGKLSGDLEGDRLQGTLEGKAIHFIAKGDGTSEEYTGTFDGDTISGSALRIDDDSGSRTPGAFTARRPPRRPPGPPRRYDFAPTAYHREFSADTKPVLRVWPGDTIHTTTVDAGGVDAAGIAQALGGNPQTGPFYVETAMPGDVLAVHLDHVRLNRDYAFSDDRMVNRALTSRLAVQMKDTGKTVRWRLDRERGLAAPASPTDHLQRYSIPVRPMLGCVAVAPEFASPPFPTGDSGSFGGNMDLPEIVEGTTVYLQVQQPGALLYVGDGHAVQGDGELTGNALETSMDVELTVDVLAHKSIGGPRVESPTHIMALGLSGSLEDAVRFATADLAQWLQDDYHLTPSELAQVLGTAMEYSINELADRNVGVVAKISKQRLATLTAAGH